MISVVIPTLNDAASLPRCFNALLDAAMSGLVREVIVVDGGSSDDTLSIADAAGARIVRGPAGRGERLAQGAEAARGEWLLFLRPDTVLETAWAGEAAAFIARALPDRAAAFRFALEDFEPSARRREALAALRSRAFALPYGEQGLLLSTRFYRKLGGYRALGRLEDVDFVRRIGRSRLVLLRSHALVFAPPGRPPRRGGSRRRELALLLLHVLRVPSPLMARLYG